jgi:hypothetical protein
VLTFNEDRVASDIRRLDLEIERLFHQLLWKTIRFLFSYPRPNSRSISVSFNST